MSESVITILSAMLSGGLIGGVTSVVLKLLEQRKTEADANKSAAEARRSDAEAAQIVSEAAQSLVEPLQKQVERLQRTVDELTVRVNYLERALQEAEDALCDTEHELDKVVNGANDLADQVTGLGADPVYKPPARSKKRS